MNNQDARDLERRPDPATPTASTAYQTLCDATSRLRAAEGRLTEAHYIARLAFGQTSVVELMQAALDRLRVGIEDVVSGSGQFVEVSLGDSQRINDSLFRGLVTGVAMHSPETARAVRPLLGEGGDQ